MEKIKFCEELGREVTKEDCKNCGSKELVPRFFKICKHKKSKVKCPNCGQVIE